MSEKIKSFKIDSKGKDTERLVEEFIVTLNNINRYMDEREQYIALLENKLARKSPLKYFFKNTLTKALKSVYKVSEKLKLTRFIKILINRFPQLSLYIKRKLKS